MPSGAIPVASAAGVAVGPLTVGQTYAIQNTGGPWFASGATQPHYFYDLSADGATWYGPIADGTTSIPPWAQSFSPIDGQHAVVVFVATHTQVWIRVHDNPASFGDNGGAMGYDLGAGAPNYCQYGVQSNPDATFYQVVTDALIDLVVAGALIGTAQAEFIPFVETMLAALEGSIFLGVDCAMMPVGANNLDFSNPASLTPDNLLKWFQKAAWGFFCQCTPAPPGSALPVPPPTPTTTIPATLPATQPTSTCDNTDLCTYLASMKAQIEQLLAQLGYLRLDVKLIQRQKVPFAYAPGALHSGLIDAGQFAVQGILGLAVQVTTVPAASGEEAGDPVARFGLGWVTTGTPDGWRNSVSIRHNPQWIDVEPDDTLVGYSLGPLVIANIEEFVREP